MSVKWHHCIVFVTENIKRCLHEKIAEKMLASAAHFNTLPYDVTMRALAGQALATNHWSILLISTHSMDTLHHMIDFLLKVCTLP